jgi:hypothetical protein
MRDFLKMRMRTDLIVLSPVWRKKGDLCRKGGHIIANPTSAFLKYNTLLFFTLTDFLLEVYGVLTIVL